jgi:ribosomal protein S18 acetylase RimI-like enzyme
MTRARASGVRLAEPADVPFITGLAGRLAEVSRLPWLPQAATDRFAARGCEQAAAAIGQPGHVVLVASGGAGEPLGFVHAHLDETAFTGEVAGYVSVVAVTAAAAGIGVGRQLMAAAEDWASQQGCVLITLEVFASNTVARSVYERLGYREQTLKLVKQLHGSADHPGEGT